jgi:gluconolactonase
MMTDLREVTTGLRFPEGPVALPDGTVLVTEIAAG